MRLLCCTDTHGLAPPALDESGATAWLHAGDVYDGPTSRRTAQELGGIPPFIRWLDDLSPPLQAVRGNHDCYDAFDFFWGGRDTSGRVIPLDPGFWLAGIGWNGERYFETPTDAELSPIVAVIERQLLRLALASDAVVLLTHYPPTLDEHRSRERDDSPAIRAFIDRVRPILVVEGHVHRRAGKSHVVIHADGRTTTVVNPGPAGCAIDINGDRVTITPSSPPPRPDSARP